MSPRVHLFVATGVAALIAVAVAAAAPVAGTAYDPQLNVSAPTAGGGYAINAQIRSATTVDSGRLSLFAPAKFSATFPAAGSEAGSASVRLQLADRGDAYVNLTGKVVVAKGDKLGCVAHTTAADASFAINLSGGGITMSIPMAAYKITGDRTKYSSYEFSQCFPPGGVPKGTAGRAPEGARLISETLTFPDLVGPKNASSYWTSGWTPYTAGSSQLDDAASVAAQAVTGAPHFLLHAKTTVKTSTKNGKKVKKTYATLSGRITRGQLGAVKVQVNVYYGSKPGRLVSTRWQTTDASGRFSYQTQVSPPYQYFQAHAKLPGRAYPASLCQPSILPYTCVGITTTRDSAQSNVVQVKAKS